MLDELKAEGLLEKTIIFFWSDHGGPLLRRKRGFGNNGLHMLLIMRLPNGETGTGKTGDYNYPIHCDLGQPIV